MVKSALLLIVFINICTAIKAQIFSTVSGHIDFISNAPLEIIKASSDQTQGILDLEKKKFAFKIYIRSFDGFNNPLQKVHFYENYMEVGDYPIATFKGKILEPINEGINTYRAKGTLLIHGVEVERIIIVQMKIEDETVNYLSTFLVPLNDHDINLPRIVYQKIAEEIEVNVSGEMKIRQ